MHLRLSADGPQGSKDVLVTADATSTVRDLAEALDRGRADDEPASTLEIVNAAQTVRLSPDEALVRSELSSGARVRVKTGADPAYQGPAGVLLHVQAGETVSRYELRSGTFVIGRSADCQVQVKDPRVSRQHVQLVVGAHRLELRDLGSANGTLVNGVPAQSAHLVNGDIITVGDADLRVEMLFHDLDGLSQQARERLARGREFIRAPRLFPIFAHEKHPAPAIPAQGEPAPFPLIMVLAPVLLAAVLFAANPNVQSLAFVIIMPLMAFGGWWENRRHHRRQGVRSAEKFTHELADLEALVRARQEREVSLRSVESPATEKVIEAISGRSRLLWARRPDLPGFLELRLGNGTTPSRVTIDTSNNTNSDSDLFRRLEETRERVRMISDVPIVADLKTSGSVGIAGPLDRRLPVASSVMLQVIGLHSPAEVVVAAILGPRSVRDWDWLKWLPHCSEAYSPFASPSLTRSEDSVSQLIAELEEFIEARSRSDVVLPRVVVLVESDAPLEMSRVITATERGGPVGVHFIWCADRLRMVPAACKTYVRLEESEAASVGFVDSALHLSPLRPERVVAEQSWESARALAPLIDAGSISEDVSGIPRSVSLLSLMGENLREGEAFVADRWGSTQSLPSPPTGQPSSRTLRAMIGQGAADTVAIDLRTHGPHALVAGTTGAGKSELLQSWVLALAVNYSPSAVTFLFVDYKGGSAFGECVRLPHTVGLVTDLSPHLVKRALTSLEAEIRYRERLLNRARAKDLMTMEALGHPDTPPSLVIVVDEFAALARDVPDFVEGVVNIAQRGRSLGLHLILATQRPAGVINDNIRANTNLRIALRMADVEDSVDVLGVPDAATFDPATPGRAAVKSGAAKIVPFQSAYAGAMTDETVSTSEIVVRDLVIGEGKTWPRPERTRQREEIRETATDLARLLHAIVQANAGLRLPPPRRPWLDELPQELELAPLLGSAPVDECLVIGRGDLPEEQRQTSVGFRPDIDGHLLIAGAGRSGKTTSLRTLAVAAGVASEGAPNHVYALDFAGRGLAPLAALPHVGAVISADEDDRVWRLLRLMRTTIEDRAQRFSLRRSGTITEYRTATGLPEPRILLLVDGLTAFRAQYDTATANNAFDLLRGIAAEGRQVGVHVAATVERLSAVPSGLLSLFPQRLLLKPGDELDLSSAGLPRSAFSEDTPPGRGYLQGTETQVAVLGGSSSVSEQASAIDLFALELKAKHPDVTAPGIRSLPDTVLLSDLVVEGSGEPNVALNGADLEPIALPTVGTFLVAGPPESGRSTCIATMVRAIAISSPRRTRILIAPATSQLKSRPHLWNTVLDPSAVEANGDELVEALMKKPSGYLLVVENPGEFVNEPADYALQAIAKAARDSGQLLISEGVTETVSGSWPLLKALRFHRRGLVLQPDHLDGDILFDTSFPRVRRADFPVGRGLWVDGGRVTKVQVAVDG